MSTGRLLTGVLVFVALFGLLGCNFGSRRSIGTLDSTLVNSKRSLVMSNERTIFEEFVKYKEHGGLISLYMIDTATFTAKAEDTSNATIGASTSTTLASGAESNVSGLTLGYGITKLTGADIQVVLKPISNAVIYDGIKAVFDRTDKANIYAIANSYTNDCRQALMCIPVRGKVYKNPDNKAGYPVYAYLSHDRYANFRKFLQDVSCSDEISLPPGTEPSKSCEGLVEAVKKATNK